MSVGALLVSRQARWAMLGALIVAAAGAALLVPRAFAPQSTATAVTDVADAAPSGTDRTARRSLLEQQVRHDPRDGRAWALLAYDDFEAERYRDAAASFEKAIAASRKLAADPGLLCDYADALGMAQGGSLEGQPTEWIARALALRPDHPKALEMAGSAAYGRRDFAMAVHYWQRLRGRLAEGSPARAALDAAIGRAQRLAATSLPSER